MNEVLRLVSAACALSAIGLWRGKRWGHRFALGILAINLTGDVINVILATEPRAAVGIPFAAALLAFLLLNKNVRAFFEPGARSPS